MPISESDFSQDEINGQQEIQSSETSTTSISSNMMSKAELRKTHKPIMEKRRRAKINNCLNEIKDLILSAMKKDPERHSKLEKADILEMAVKHLKNIQKQQKEIAIRNDPTLALKYKTGFLECASEVSTFVDQIEGIDPGLKHRLTNHLNKYANTVDRESQPQFNFTSSSLLASFAAQSRFREDDNNNRNNPGMGIQLIPSCLPNGDFAFLVPKASFNSILSSSGVSNVGLDLEKKHEEQQPHRPSAFVTVTPRSEIARPLSPPVSPPATIVKPKAEKPIVMGIEKIRNIKFPIHNQKKEPVPEPLCIITNGIERFRHAHQISESRNEEENVFHGEKFACSTGGIKRKAREEGLLTVAPHLKYPRIEKSDNLGSAFRSVAKDFKRENFDKTEATSSSTSSNLNLHQEEQGERESNDDKNDTMWRPW